MQEPGIRRLELLLELVLAHGLVVLGQAFAEVVGAVLLGGTLFGAGWAVMGYCPGTSIGALGEGRWHAVFAVAGMLIGAALYAELYPFFKSTVLTWKDFGRIGVPETLGVSVWVIIPMFWAGVIFMFRWFEKKGL